MQVERRQVLAFRMAAQGLRRDGGHEVMTWSLLDLGVQDTPPGSAAQALAARLGVAARPLAQGLATTWTFRGAPHVQRADDLLRLSRALWPVSDEDALTRLDTSASPVRSTDMAPRETLRFVAEQIADIVTEPMPKGEVSRALTPRIPPELTVDCRACKATHIVETLFRSAVLPAGMAFDPEARGVVFAPIRAWPGPPTEASGVADVVRAYFQLHGPATLADAAAFLGGRAQDLEPHAPDGLVTVQVLGDDGDGLRLAQARHEDVDMLRDPPDPPTVRLVPPSDPFLQARDRDLAVPDGGRRKALWPILGRPGALLVEAEVAGIWRARKKGRRLELAVEPFGRLSRAARRGLDAEAELVAAARGAASVDVSVG